LDDFQVRTPTDIIGQHIHLPKWDLTTGDGAANGWNYEDGAMAPLMVQERIHAINNFNALAGTSTLLTDILTGLGIEVNPLLAAAVANHQVDLTDLAAVPTIDTGDSGSTIVAGMTELHAQPHPFFLAGVADEYLGARTVIQRILIDPVHNVAGYDRGLGLTFSHDHYGPSTFQQIGLYSTILAEPQGSTWVHNESGELLNTRHDGGPTTWQAAIITDDDYTPYVEDHREFYFEMSDFQHAYEAGFYVGAGPDGRPIQTNIEQPDPFNVTVATAPDIDDMWQKTVNPPLKLKVAAGFPDVVTAHGACPGPGGNFDTTVPRPCAEAINISHSSTWVVNYRNEPLGLRVYDPGKEGPDGQDGAQADGQAGDLAFALQTRDDRAFPGMGTALGVSPYPTAPYCQETGDGIIETTGDGISCDRMPGDPFTPIMRAFEGDEVKIKIQVGATEEQHQTTVHGIKWLSNGSAFGRSPNSGWRNFQSHGISEQFSLQVPINPDLNQPGSRADYLYATDATRPGFWLGTWGVLRSYGQNRNDLFELPDNPPMEVRVTNQRDFDGVCPKSAFNKEFDVVAVLANDVLPNTLGVTIPANINGDSDDVTGGDNAGGPLNPAGGTLVYNRRGTVVPAVGAGPLNDPTAMLYVLAEDLVAKNPADLRCSEPKGKGKGGRDENILLEGCPVTLAPNVPVEPLILRANAGDCIDVTLHNKLVDQAEAGGVAVFSCEDDGLGACVPDTETALFDTGQAADDVTAGRLFVDADGLFVAVDPVTLAPIVFDDVMPDLAGWQDMMWGVTRRIQGADTGAEMYFFNNNLIRPSSSVGLHPQLVEYDIARSDGAVVGVNRIGQLARPGGRTSYRWYAGHLEHEFVRFQGNRKLVELVATPIEFGASNLLSADRIKQPQKGLFGALVIEPQGAMVAEDTVVPDGQGLEVQGQPSPTRPTRAQVTVTAPAGDAGSGGTYREALSIGHKIANLRWADGSAIKNIHQGELGREGAEDSGHAGFNYAMEPSWFRFKLAPDVPFGNAGTPNSFGSIPNQQAFYANALVAGEPNSIPAIPGVSAADDPVTPVFRTTADTQAPYNPVTDTRMYVLNGASADRDGTFIVHGHLWQRDPYVCTGLSQDASVPLAGRCDPDETAPSQALGLNPQGKYMGSQEGMGHVYGHWPILFDAGGTGAVPGDYLYRDYSPSGNRNGQFGILRVKPE
jgi:hypothetical protein